MLADQLHCPVEELPHQGYLVRSAGLAAFPGVPAAAEAIEIAREFGVDIQGHISQSITGELIFQSDYIIAMTQGHVQSLLHRFPNLGPPPRLLCMDGAEVPDPIGCEKPVYRDCAELLRKSLEPWVQKFQEG
jgi:protein-tyrosine phosphatase